MAKITDGRDPWGSVQVVTRSSRLPTPCSTPASVAGKQFMLRTLALSSHRAIRMSVPNGRFLRRASTIGGPSSSTSPADDLLLHQ